MDAPASTALHTTSARLHDRPASPSGARSLPDRVGDFEVLERIAVGGMAEIFKARKQGEHGFAKLFALKKILPHLANDRASVEMFLDEARITASLEHPKIIQAFELGNDADSLYFAMEYVDGIDVLRLLQDCARAQIRLPATLAARIARDVLDALDYAHEARDANGRSLAIVHRDVSPSNILLSWQGDVKLTDFGVALAARRRHQTAQHTLRGKYGYMSPEQVSGGHVDNRSDLFSVGVVLAEMVMARRLFVGPTDLDVLLAVRDVKLDRLDAHAREFPLDLLGIVLRALQLAPRDRWQTAGEMRDALDEWLARQDRAASQELAAFVSTVTTAPSAVIDPTASSIFVRPINPRIPLGAVRMAQTKRPLPGLVPAAPDTEEIELSEIDALEVIDEHDDVFSAPTANGLDVEQIKRAAAQERVGELSKHLAVTAKAPAPLVEALVRPMARKSSIVIDTADIVLDDDDDAPIDDRPTEQDMLAGIELALDEVRAPTPAPVQNLVATVQRRKKQHTVETAIASLLGGDNGPPPARVARGTGRFATPSPVAPKVTLPLPGHKRSKLATGTPPFEMVEPDEADDAVAPHAYARRPSTGIPVEELLPLPPRRPSTSEIAPRRAHRASTSVSVVSHVPLPIKNGKLGRMSVVGKAGDFANFSDALESADEPVVAPKRKKMPTGKLVLQTLAKVTGMDNAPPEEPAPVAAPVVLAAPSGTSLHDEEPRSLMSRLASPYGMLALLTLAMIAVFLLAMYGVI